MKKFLLTTVAGLLFSSVTPLNASEPPSTSHTTTTDIGPLVDLNNPDERYITQKDRFKILKMEGMRGKVVKIKNPGFYIIELLHSNPPRKQAEFSSDTIMLKTGDIVAFDKLWIHFNPNLRDGIEGDVRVVGHE